MASDKSSSPQMTSPDQSMIIGRSLCDLQSDEATKQAAADRSPAPADASHPVLSMIKEMAVGQTEADRSPAPADETPLMISMIKETAAPKGQCECHKVDWTGGPYNYKYIETGDPYQQGDLISCQDKINDDLMSCDDYESICQYIPGKEGSNFPIDVYNKLLSGEY